MRKHLKNFCCISICCALFILVGCKGNNSTASSPPAEKVVLDISDQSAVLGDKVTLNCLAKNGDGKALTVKSCVWSVKDPLGNDISLTQLEKTSQAITFLAEDIGEYKVFLAAKIMDRRGIVEKAEAEIMVDVESLELSLTSPLTEGSYIKNIPIDLGSLSWSFNGKNSPVYQVYYGRDYPLAQVAYNQSANFIKISRLPYDSTIYLRVIAINGSEEYSVIREWTLTTPASNSPPIARAKVKEGSLFVNRIIGLDGHQSSDAEGSPLTYLWEVTEFPSGAEVLLESESSADPNLIVDKPGEYEVSLTVSDGTSESFSYELTLNVTDVVVSNYQPLNGARDVARNVSLSWSCNDPEHKFYVYFGKKGSSLSLIGQQAECSINPGPLDPNTSYQWIVVPEDKDISDFPVQEFTTVKDASNSNSRPTVNAGLDSVESLSATVTLDGTAVDPEGDSLSYFWVIVSKPSGSVASIINPNLANAQIALDKEGDYILEFMAKDSQMNESLPDQVKITALQPIISEILPADNATVKSPFVFSWSCNIPGMIFWVIRENAAFPNSVEVLSDPNGQMEPLFDPNSRGIEFLPGEVHWKIVISKGQYTAITPVMTLTIEDSQAIPAIWIKEADLALTRQVVVDPLDPNRVYAGTEMKGIWVSDRGGAAGSWRQLSNLGNRSIYGIAIDPVCNSIIYAATWGNGLFKTTDRGETWIYEPSLGQPWVGSIGFYPGDLSNKTMFAVCMDGIWRTTDGWVTAQHILSDRTGLYNSLAFDGCNIYAATNKGVVKSIDAGATWAEKNFGLASVDVRTIEVVGPNKLACGVENVGIYYSEDGGERWTLRNNGLGFSLAVKDLLSFSQNVYCGIYNGGIYVNNNIALSQPWQNFSQVLTGNAFTIWSIAANAKKKFLIIGTEDGVWRRGIIM